MASELDAIARLRAIFGPESGIGDDAAVVCGDLVWTIDAQVEGTHFRREWLSWEDVGWRSFMAAASDLAAMGSRPIAALSALSVTSDEIIDAIARGQAAAAAVVGAPVVGGNLARGKETSITTTLLGRAAKPILRSGACPGDGLWLSGDVGLAAAGLRALQNNVQHACIAAWRRPAARIAEGLAMAGIAHAAIDVSDGVARDASHVAEASNVRIVIDPDALVTPLLVHAAEAVGEEALALALGGGEDYALLAASAAPILGFRRIGTIEAYGSGARVWLGDRPIEASGFDHFGS